jgi:ribosome-binding protein aMBF1 (putative translation factor)
MKTNCQWCGDAVTAKPETIAKAKAGEVMIVCPTCKAIMDQNHREVLEYATLLRQPHTVGAGSGTL